MIQPEPGMDDELLLRCQRGDRQAFNRLVMQYQHLIYNFLYRLAPDWADLDDLAQEVFLKMYHSIHTLHDRAQFKSWLHRLAVNVYVDEQRRRAKRRNRFVSDDRTLETRADPAAHPGEHIARQELQHQLQAALNQLPEEFKLAVVLREIQGLSYDEIAETLRCSIGTVRSRIFRGRRLLRQLLAPESAAEDGA
jgi:RNA polymerase sigma-70 factor, ECF subfamily